MIPNPGSKEAEKQGCTCPILDNSYGKGYMMQEGVFVVTQGCPLHDPKGKIAKEEKVVATPHTKKERWS